MDISYYQISQKIGDDVYLCYNSFTDSYILLKGKFYELYISKKFKELENDYPKIFSRLLSGGFIIEDNYNEYKECQKIREKKVNDSTLYHIIINPTLDCNLNCWYCYENKIKNSLMSGEVIEALKKHIPLKHLKSPFSTLKLSFFGGEPFMGFSVMKDIINYANNYCSDKEINLILDFTTNGTLCSPKVLEFLQDFNCSFQITLDGNKEQHNKIKQQIKGRFDTYTATVENIKNIQRVIKNSFVAVRINFDQETLKGFEEILRDLFSLDRKRSKIILKKVWQVDEKIISKELLQSTINSLFENNFVVDYYSQGGVCFADRANQVVINYDGNVFKCTTIASFNKTNSLGFLDLNTGDIHWNNEKLEYLKSNKVLEACVTCKLYPKCGGPCRKRIKEEPQWSCPMANPNFDMDNYIRIQFNSRLKLKFIHER